MARQPKTGKQKMRDYRERMRAAALRPIQIWVPDIRSRGFAANLRRQVNALDTRREADVLDFIEQIADRD